MLRAWRIVKHAHAATAFSGEGAMRVGGRWNSRGTRVVYASATQSLAVLESLVHLNPMLVFAYVAMTVDFPETMVETIGSGLLREDWAHQPPPASTKQIGDRWVREARSAVLAVPSVIVPAETNYLLNPAHAEYHRLKFGPPAPFVLDSRLIRQTAS
jgi:RES domain-containing protein